MPENEIEKLAEQRKVLPDYKCTPRIVTKEVIELLNKCY